MLVAVVMEAVAIVIETVVGRVRTGKVVAVLILVRWWIWIRVLWLLRRTRKHTRKCAIRGKVVVEFAAGRVPI